MIISERWANWRRGLKLLDEKIYMWYLPTRRSLGEGVLFPEVNAGTVRSRTLERYLIFENFLLDACAHSHPCREVFARSGVSSIEGLVSVLKPNELEGFCDFVLKLNRAEVGYYQSRPHIPEVRLHSAVHRVDLLANLIQLTGYRSFRRKLGDIMAKTRQNPNFFGDGVKYLEDLGRLEWVVKCDVSKALLGYGWDRTDASIGARLVGKACKERNLVPTGTYNPDINGFEVLVEGKRMGGVIAERTDRIGIGVFDTGSIIDALPNFYLQVEGRKDDLYNAEVMAEFVYKINRALRSYVEEGLTNFKVPKVIDYSGRVVLVEEAPGKDIYDVLIDKTRPLHQRKQLLERVINSVFQSHDIYETAVASIELETAGCTAEEYFLRQRDAEMQIITSTLEQLGLNSLFETLEGELIQNGAREVWYCDSRIFPKMSNWLCEATVTPWKIDYNLMRRVFEDEEYIYLNYFDVLPKGLAEHAKAYWMKKTGKEKGNERLFYAAAALGCLRSAALFQNAGKSEYFGARLEQCIPYLTGYDPSLVSQVQRVKPVAGRAVA